MELPASATPWLVAYLAVEVVFCLVFWTLLVPIANRRTSPHAYRDYGRHRHTLLLRILARMEQSNPAAKVRTVMRDFLLQWFEERPVVVASSRPQDVCPPVTSVSETSSLSSNAEESTSDESSIEGDSERWTIPGLGREDVDEFFAWAFFGKEPADLETWEVEELDKCYREIEEHQGLVFAEGSPGIYKPRRLSLEDVSPLHRPLLVYIIVWLLRTAAGVILRLLGFQLLTAQSGLRGWYRPARPTSQHYLPLLFFHGIAPGGLVFYLPMLLFGLVSDGRAVYLFENPSISCVLGYRALTEYETVEGVQELVHATIGDDCGLALAGHSFGSCQLTWLLHSPLSSRIRQFVLMDPVTILLSEPDVMNNFLYSRHVNKIRMLASSELFTEYYLRRHFSWYNSELWLEDLPMSTKLLVALSEHDEIIHSPKVKRALDWQARPNTSVLYWKHVGHADCVTSPRKWREMKARMLGQELVLQQE